ncbi:MAG: SGNH/GDSL hydrolase family protein [Fusobacteriaceae bacterium]|nr:SGNH/GDSL hydrolase family protein [Fusobacteriaceae bacterium]
MLKLFKKKNKNVEKKIFDMNREENLPILELKDEQNFEKTIKVLIIGNSLTLHPISEKVNWERVCGMAASSKENDYVHLLFEKLKTYKENILFKYTNYAIFEREFEKISINELVEFNANFIIFQLGDNVSDLDNFKQNYIELINCFKNEKTAILLTTPFFYSNEKNRIVSDVAKNTDSFLIDLSNLYSDKRNFAKAEYNYKHKGVGLHPGDFGMKNIADAIFITINAIKKRPI